MGTELFLTTNSGSITMHSDCPSFSPFRLRSITRLSSRTAALGAPSRCCRTEVSGGQKYAASGVASNPTTAKFPARGGLAGAQPEVRPAPCDDCRQILHLFQETARRSDTARAPHLLRTTMVCRSGASTKRTEPHGRTGAPVLHHRVVCSDQRPRSPASHNTSTTFPTPNT